MEARGFGSEEFAKFHPGGTLGKKLYLRVADLFYQNEKPSVMPDSSLKEVIIEITRKRLGATAVIDNHNKLLGIITDGDLRRMLEKNISLQHIKAMDIMTTSPKSISSDKLAVDALDVMRKNNITQLLVIEDERYSGIIHLHDLVREGII
jgi:arabinose-5-phosphate isomerase